MALISGKLRLLDILNMKRTAPEWWTLQTARTIQHLHNCEVEEVLEGAQTQLPITQQDWPPLINEHIF